MRTRGVEGEGGGGKGGRTIGGGKGEEGRGGGGAKRRRRRRRRRNEQCVDRRGPEGRELAGLKLGDSSTKRVGQRDLGVKVSWKLNRDYMRGLGLYFPP